MKAIYLLVFVIFTFFLTTSCTENQRARGFGGKETIYLPKGQKLINVTWKEGNDIWYLTKPMSPNDSTETYIFGEKSSLGVWEGTITIVETK